MAHLQTTPTGKTQSSRSLVRSPPNLPCRLTFGSSKKEGGYGIVSASGLSAWRRGVKRGSTSTNKENTTITTATTTGTGSHSNPLNRDFVKKKGLGMGLEGTPARKRFKRDSKKSKTSMGTQSTPKASMSRVAPSALQGSESPSLSMSMTISSFTSNSGTSESPIESGSSAVVPPQGPAGDDTFAVGADTIVGEDVFGLTISIDADGTMRPWSPGHTLSATPPFERSRWLDEDDDETREEEFDRLVEWAEVDVPVDFGDETNDVDNDLTPGAEMIPQEVEMTEVWSEGIDPTRIWDITVPIRETSVLSFSSDIDFDENEITQFDQICTSFERGLGDETIRADGMSRPGSRPKDIKAGGSGEASGRYVVNENGNEADTDSIENSRGLNISKLGLGVDVSTGDAGDETADMADITPAEHILPPIQGNERSSREAVHPVEIQDDIDEVEEIDYTSKVRDPTSILMQDNPLQFNSLSSTATSSTAYNSEDDPHGFMAAEKFIKRERPRWYRATSSPTPPPPSRRLTSLTYSPTPEPPLHDSPTIEVDEATLARDTSGVVWKGAWKGRRSHRTMQVKDDASIEMGGHSRDSAGRGKGQVEKVFIEPEYHGKAKRARDARIAHYKDLETNYKLAVEAVYF